MKTCLKSAIGMLLILAVVQNCACTGPSRAAINGYVTQIDELMPGMGADKIVDRQDAQLQLEKTCFEASAPGHEKDRAALSVAITERLDPDVPKPARVWMLRKIEPLGRDEVVASLARLLNDEDPQIRELARRALQNNPSPKAADALRKALSRTNCPVRRVAFINALGFRQDAESVGMLVGLADDDNVCVASAAIAALAKIGNDRAIAKIDELRADPRDELYGEIADASLRCAEQMQARGCPIDKVLKVYEGLWFSSAPAAIRIAAMNGYWSANRAATAPVKPKITIASAVRDKDEAVRVYAISAMAGTATEKQIPHLVKLLMHAQGEKTRLAARNTLTAACLRIDDEERRSAPILAALAKAKPQDKAPLIGVLGELQGESALETLRQCAQAKENVVSEAAKRALSGWEPMYCTKWMFSGPYREEGKDMSDLFDTPFAPEKPDADAQWKPLGVTDPGQPQVFNLEKIAPAENCCGYAKTSIWSEKQQEALLAMGSDDGIKVWLNGAVVHEHNTNRSITCGEDTAAVTLKEGWNTLLIKITQGGKGWGFCCGIRASDGGPMAGLKIKAE